MYKIHSRHIRNLILPTVKYYRDSRLSLEIDVWNLGNWFLPEAHGSQAFILATGIPIPTLNNLICASTIEQKSILYKYKKINQKILCNFGDVYKIEQFLMRFNYMYYNRPADLITDGNIVVYEVI